MKRGLLIFALVLMSEVTHAQLNKFEVGVEGGPLLSGIIDPGQPDQNDNQSWVLHYSLALVGQYNFDSILSIKSGISFERKGYAPSLIEETILANNNPSADYFPAAVRLNYLVLPVFLKASWGNKAKFFVNGGPYFGYLINAYTIMVSNGLASPNYINSISTNTYNRIDAELGAGFGWDIPLNKRLILDWELRFSFGLLNTGSPFGTGITENQSANLLFWIKV